MICNIISIATIIHIIVIGNIDILTILFRIIFKSSTSSCFRNSGSSGGNVFDFCMANRIGLRVKPKYNHTKGDIPLSFFSFYNNSFAID